MPFHHRLMAAFDHSGPLDFDCFAPEQIGTLIDLLRQQGHALNTILEDCAQDITWEHAIVPLCRMQDRFGQLQWLLLLYRDIGAISEEHGVDHTSALLDTEKCLLKRPDLLARLEAFQHETDWHAQPPTRRLELDILIDKMRQSCHDTPHQQQLDTIRRAADALLESIHHSRAQPSAVLPERCIAPEHDLDPISEACLAQARRTAADAGVPGYRLRQDDCLTLISHCDNRQLRETVWRHMQACFNTISQSQLEQMSAYLTLRQEEARLSGYANFASMNSYGMMLDSPKEIAEFLAPIQTEAETAQERRHRQPEWQACAAAAGIDTIEKWDETYLERKMRDAAGLIDDEQTRDYFPVSRVLDGLCRLIEGLFGIRVSPQATDGWHAQVTCLRLEQEGTPTGYLYLDLYRRCGKSDNIAGAAYSLRFAHRSPDLWICPVTAILCNFRTAQEIEEGQAQCAREEAAWLSHTDVSILFHEVGHALHHLLSYDGQTSHHPFQSIEGDAIEMLAIFFQQFCFEPEVLQMISAHRETGEPVPAALAAKLVQGAAFNANACVLKVLEASRTMLDACTGHMPSDPGQQAIVLDTLEMGLHSGYYSYLLGHILANDLFSAFQRHAAQGHSIVSRHWGDRYVRTILRPGGKRSMFKSIATFHGYQGHGAGLADYSI